jgi:2-amino-4-hydroxy-6-hydroxymethyldihydropteridine diphosphokinase
MASLNRGRQLIELLVGPVLECSSIYETAAWGNQEQEAYLNQVLRLQTRLGPFALLQQLLDIERRLGRRRDPDSRWQPRTLDLDILFYADAVIYMPGLQIPHPSMQDRLFVLKPLAELQPERLHPKSGQTVQSMLDSCQDPLEVSIFASR